MWVKSTSDTFSEKRFRQRLRLTSLVFAAGYVIIAVRLFYLQVLEGDYLSRLSESNRTQVVFLRAPRGDFVDRHGRAFVSNRPSWSLIYSVPEGEKSNLREVQQRLQSFLASFPKRWVKRLKQAFETGQMVRLAEDIPNPIAFGLRETGELLPGLRVVMEFKRGYPAGVSAGHLVGYLGEVDEKDLQSESPVQKKPGDLVGKLGLEKILDDKLRGQDGGMLIEVDSIGRLKRVIEELPSRKGSEVHLTLDLDVQRTAEELFLNTETQRGAAVMIDVNTGEVLCWFSSPPFNPGDSLAEDLVDPRAPLFDRVYKGAYPPGSLFKVVTAIAGFEAGIINPAEKVDCVGHVSLVDKRTGERKYRCWKTHGRVDFWRAVAESCDTYFYLLGQRVGPEAMASVASRFGLGNTVQDLLPGETKGLIPTPAWKRQAGKGGWSTGDSFNTAIGQGDVSTTPLQMAVLAMGLANRGTMIQPHVVDKIVSQKGVVSAVKRQYPTLSISLKDSTWERIEKAMKLVVEQGTGAASRIPYLDVWGKTGTAQNPHGNDHAWFMAIAGYPGEKPAVAVCVLVENGGNGSTAAAPIAKKLIETALPPRQVGIANAS